MIKKRFSCYKSTFGWRHEGMEVGRKRFTGFGVGWCLCHWPPYFGNCVKEAVTDDNSEWQEDP